MARTAAASLVAFSIAAAFLGGCASSPLQKRAAELQYPQLTPKAQWSQAMIVLQDDMGIVGQADVPKAKADDRELVIAQIQRFITRSSDPLHGATLAVTGAASPPSGFSSGAAAGMGLALAVIPASQPAGPWQYRQLVAWVPADQAQNMEEAITIASRDWQVARERAFTSRTKIEAQPSKFPDGNFSVRKTLHDILYEKVARPEGAATDGPSFLPPGRYYGPIYFQKFSTQVIVDSKKSGRKEDDNFARLSSALPPYFALYLPGRIPQYGKGEIPPAVFTGGKRMPFIGR